MLSLNKIWGLMLMAMMISGCQVDTHPDDLVLDIHFAPAHEDHWDWAAATTMIFHYHNIHYSQNDLVDYQYHYFHYTSPSIDDISWLMWDLGGLDSYITGSLTFRDIRSHINDGNPILLQYGGYFSGHVIVIHGYDHQGHVYIHEPGYGTRVIHYNDLYYRYFQGIGLHWESSLILRN